jgi:hypothetical protein
MKKIDKIWLIVMASFWSSLIVTFLIDFLGIVDASNLGYVETVWISWIMWTVGLGLTLAILTRFIVKE